MPLPDYPRPNDLRYMPFVIPATFRELMSYPDQIHWLVYHIVWLSERTDTYLTEAAFDEWVDAWLARYEREQAAQTDELKEYTDTSVRALKDYTDDELAALRTYLLSVIGDIVLGKISVVDPSTGFVSPINEALSHMYNDLCYWSATCDEVEGFIGDRTWDEWDAVIEPYTVKQLDLLFANIFLGQTEPRAITLPQDM